MSEEKILLAVSRYISIYNSVFLFWSIYSKTQKERDFIPCALKITNIISIWKA